MELDPSNWTLATAEQLHKNIQRVLLETTSGGSVSKYTTEAQNFETTFNMPFPELVTAVENLLIAKRCEGENRSNTSLELWG